MILGFVISDVWKEHNSSIFKNKTCMPQHKIDQILRQLKDTVKSLLGKFPEDPPLPQDACIQLHLGLQAIVPQGINKGVSQINADMNI